MRHVGNPARLRVRVEAVNEACLDAGAQIEERERIDGRVEFIGESGRVLINLQFDTGQRVSGGLGLQDPDRLGLDEQHIVREAVAVRHLELPNGDARSSRQIQLIAVLNKPSSGVQGLVDLLARPLLWGEWVHCFSLKKLLGP